LFNAFLNDLVIKLELESLGVYLYADDIAVLCRNKEHAKSIIYIVKGYCRENGLELNLKKCGLMFIKNKCKCCKNKNKNKLQDLLGIPIV